MSEGPQRSIGGARAWALVGLGGLLVAGGALAGWSATGARSWSERAAGEARAGDHAPPPIEASPMVAPEVPAAALPDHVRWIAVGGGSSPELNQLSLEEDLLLAREVLGEGGVVLFAGGSGTRSVQVTDDEERGDPLRRELAELLSGRSDRGARYQPTRLAVHGAATLDRTMDALAAALGEGDAPLLLWVASHGDRGERPTDSRALLWAGTELDPQTLYDAIDGSSSRRSLRMVITSCYAGGFAELAFDQLDPERGPTDLDVCGLFATSWDEEAAGCDPHPDRASHEAWSIHFLEALRGRDREGHDVRAVIDLDDDARISLAEASAYARIVALSFDLPTTTSARLLRALAPRSGPRTEVSLLDEESVVRGIGARLAIEGEPDVQARLDALARRRVELEAAYEARSAEADEVWWALVGELLSRWPVIDDPWHPDFEPTMVREASAIRAFLDRSAERARWLEAQDELHALDSSLASLRVQAAPLRRWLEAHETIDLASRLRAVGGAGWERYERMRACEGSAP